jgi:hypothetical protein
LHFVSFLSGVNEVKGGLLPVRIGCSQIAFYQPRSRKARYMPRICASNDARARGLSGLRERSRTTNFEDFRVGLP